MDDGDGAEPPAGQVDELAVERLPAQLLQVAGGRAALLQPGQVLLGREQLERVDRVRREVAVPERRAATGQHGRLLALDPVPPELAPQERDPVLELVTDLADEGPEENRTASAESPLGASRLRPDDRFAPRCGGGVPGRAWAHTGAPSRRRTCAAIPSASSPWARSTSSLPPDFGMLVTPILCTRL